MQTAKTGFELVQSATNPNVWLVRVDSNVLQCDHRPLPYPTYIGMIDIQRWRISIWTPAASKPRGYRAAAKEALQEICDELRRNSSDELESIESVRARVQAVFGGAS